MARNTKRKKTPEKAPAKLPAKETFTLAKPLNPKCSPGKQGDQHSEVKMFLVPIGTSRGYGLFFKREGTPPYASWADKLLFDLVVHQPTVVQWITDINLYNVTFELHYNDAPLINRRNWAVRVYLGFAGEELTSTILLEIANVVRRNINAMGELRENQNVTVDPETFLEAIDASWFDFLGQDGAKKLARKLLNEDTQALGTHFSENPDDFHCFWKSGQISLDIARSISLPANMSTEIRDIDDIDDISE
jgi:hypothetical protein